MLQSVCRSWRLIAPARFVAMWHSAYSACTDESQPAPPRQGFEKGHCHSAIEEQAGRQCRFDRIEESTICLLMGYASQRSASVENTSTVTIGIAPPEYLYPKVSTNLPLITMLLIWQAKPPSASCGLIWATLRAVLETTVRTY